MRCIKNKPIFTSLLFILIFSSCGKEFLTENPRDRLVDESFFKTVKHIEQSIHPLYALASRISRDAMVIGVQLGADDLLTVDDLNKSDFQEFDLFDRNGVNRRSQGIWSWSYFTIQQSNFILDNVDRADAHLEVKNLAKAQARFFRAYSYFWLTRLWGRIPLVTSSDAAEDIRMGEVEEIYDLILDDLEFAESHLPMSTWNTPDLSVEVVDAMPELWKENSLLVHQGWVKSFRANVYLTMAGWPLGRTEFYAMAAQDAAVVINNAESWGYRLLEDYQELWLKENNFNDEGIIWFAHAPDAVFLHLAPNSGRPIDEPDGIMRGWNDYMVEIPFYESFPEGYRKEVTFTTGWYTGKVGNESSWVEWQDHGYRHPYVAKWRSTDGFPHDSTWTSEYKPNTHHRAMQTLRYAHVLLMYAEASARASGGVPDALAVECLNQIRRRANNLDIYTSSSFDYQSGSEDFLEAVIAEKGWEFIAEPESRWYDLVRLEKVESTLQQIISDRVDIKTNPDNPHYPLHKAVLTPGQRTPVPTEIRQLHWLKYPENDVFITPELFEEYNY